LKGSPVKDSNRPANDKSRMILSEVRPATALLGPMISDKNKNAWCLWVCSSTTGLHQNQRWNGYLLDGDASAVVAPLVMPLDWGRSDDGQLDRINGSKTKLRHLFANDDGSIVAEDETELSIERSAYEQFGESVDSSSSLPLLRHALIRTRKDGEVIDHNFEAGLKDIQAWKHQDRDNQKYTINAFVAPFFFTVKEYGNDEAVLYYSPRKTVTRRLKMTLDELKQVSNITSKIEYDCEKEQSKKVD